MHENVLITFFFYRTLVYLKEKTKIGVKFEENLYAWREFILKDLYLSRHASLWSSDSFISGFLYVKRRGARFFLSNLGIPETLT